jgi:hypothetical protein
MVKFVEQNRKNSGTALFSIQDSKVKFRFENLFKRFHSRINLTTLFLTKIYLVNTKTLSYVVATLRNLNL